MRIYTTVWAMSQKNLSIGSYQYQPAQLQELARNLKFCLKQV